MRRPLFGRYGRWVVLGFCSWEVAALTVGRVPTISSTVRRHRWFGAALLAALTHHFYVEAVEVVTESAQRPRGCGCADSVSMSPA